ncbi:MAG TPA: hypothetical protein VHE35_06335 [Kofleriaceae bacterium]|nr:hypothetical protein [Kofleriaceae bacterium]
MPLLLMAGVFVGIGGPGPGTDRVDRQVAALVHHDAGVDRVEPGAGERPTLMHGGRTAEAIVRRLDHGMVVAGWLDDADLQLVVYDADGVVVDRISIDAAGGELDRKDLEQLRATLVADLRGKAPPLGTAPPEAAPAASEEAGDAGEASAGGGSAGAADGTDAGAADDEVGDDEPRLRLRLAAGVGLGGRRFSAGPAGGTGSDAAPVPALVVAGRVQPAPKVELDVSLERTVAMSTDLGGDAVDSSITRWEAAARIALGRRLRVVAGAGRRDVVIDSKLLARSPDAHYGYLIAGVDGALHLGRRASLHGAVALEPVVTGEQPTMASLGGARRWAIDGTAGVEVALPHALHLDVAADVQRFAWSWPAAGARGDGGASDTFSSIRHALGGAQ